MKLDPFRVVVEMKKRHCDKCNEDQWVFFMNRDQYKSWICPCQRLTEDEK